MKPKLLDGCCYRRYSSYGPITTLRDRSLVGISKRQLTRTTLNSEKPAKIALDW